MFSYEFLVHFSKFFGLFFFSTAFMGIVLYVLLRGDDMEKNSAIPLKDEEED